MRGFFFFNYGALGALFPFLPLLLSARGLSPARIAWVMVLVPVSNMLIPPLWGALADALQSRVALLRIACLGSCLAVLGLVPRLDFVGTLVAVGLFSIFRAPLSALGDASAYDVLGGRRANFSTIRVYGSVGFGFFVLLSGAIGERCATGDRVMVLVTSAIFFLAGLSTIPLRPDPRQREPRVLAQTLSILRRAPVALFLGGTAAYYVGHAIYDSCFSLYLRQSGHGDGFVGAAWAVGVVAEIALMLAAPRFLHRLPSGLWLLICAVLAALRWALLSSLEGAPSLLLAQTLHAGTFGLWYLALVKFAQERAPDRLRTSLQASTLAAMGLGMIVGYLLGGHALERWGGATLFQLALVSAVAAAGLYGASWLLERRSAMVDGERDQQR